MCTSFQPICFQVYTSPALSSLETIELSNKQDLIDIYETFDPTAAENIFFSNVHGAYNEIYQMHGHKINLKIFKRIEITWRIFSDRNGIKLEIYNRKQESLQTLRN